MKPHRLFECAVAIAGLLHAAAGENEASRTEDRFRHLPMEARRLTGPLFWMHGDESRPQLESELEKVLEGGNGTLTAESRPHKDWLGEGWYRDLAINVDFARKNNLTMFIFDDWWWPSQMMGGRVPATYGSKLLEATAVHAQGPAKAAAEDYGDANLIAVVAGLELEGGVIDGQSLVDLTPRVKSGRLDWDIPAGSWSIKKIHLELQGGKG